jgi:hypothetical protein
MPVRAVVDPPLLVEPAEARGPAPRPTGRWSSLDVLRGLALVAMIVHHFVDWTGGRARERLVGFDAFALTDLAAPAFTLGAGAAAYLVGQRIRRAPAAGAGPDADRSAPAAIDRARARQAAWRWSQVLLLGLAIDVAVGGGIDGGGVLPSLAVLGALVTLASALGARSVVAWWASAAVCAALAVPAKAWLTDGFVAELVSGSFSIVVYGTFAAAGAALAAGSGSAGEGALPLWRAAATVVAAGVLATSIWPGLAPDGLWAPSRHPGDLAFTVWGLAACLAAWALVRAFVPIQTRVGGGLARAGQRTLLVFGAHYVLKLVLQHTGLQGTLDGPVWTLATWLAIGGAVALATIPPRGALRRVIPSRDETTPDPTVPVVRAPGGGAGRSGPPEEVLPGRVPPG